MARASGLHVEPDDVIRLEALRAAALSTWPVDTREVDWAMEHATMLVDRLAAEHDQEVAAAATAALAAASAEDGHVPDGHGGDDGEAADDRDAGPGCAHDEPAGALDSDVTVHCDEPLPIVRTSFDQSSAER
jgi:hypothetical protein